MRVFQRQQHALNNAEGLARQQILLLLQKLAHTSAMLVFHDDRQVVTFDHHVFDRHDVLVVQLREHGAFAHKPLKKFAVFVVFGLEEFSSIQRP